MSRLNQGPGVLYPAVQFNEENKNEEEYKSREAFDQAHKPLEYFHGTYDVNDKGFKRKVKEHGGNTYKNRYAVPHTNRYLVSQHSEEEDTSHFWESNDKVIRTSKARYAKGQVAVHIKSDDTGYKHRGHRLVDHLNARYTHRERAYILSPTKSKKLKELYESGHDASGFYDKKLIPPTQKDNQ